MRAIGFGRFASTLRNIDRSRASPNHNARLDGFETPDCIILHYTGMQDGRSAIDWLCDPASQVSCHYVVEEDGSILQLVPEERRAWHAGRSFWAGVTDINSVSLGIEIVNGGHAFGLPSYPDTQIDAVIALCIDIIARHGIRAQRVLAHSDIAPSRKRDPGERFPWHRLAAEGVGHWPVASRPQGATDRADDVAVLQAKLAQYGYLIPASGITDPETEIVVRAFQRHFQPGKVDGFADAESVQLLDALLDSLRREPNGPYPTE